MTLRMKISIVSASDFERKPDQSLNIAFNKMMKLLTEFTDPVFWERKFELLTFNKKWQKLGILLLHLLNVSLSIFCKIRVGMH